MTRVISRVTIIFMQNDARLRLIIESAPYAMIIVDQMGKILFVNPQAARTFGYSREELLGRQVEMLIPSRVRDRHIQDRNNFQAHPSVRPMGVGRDLYGLRKDGSQVPVEIGLTPIEMPDGRQVLASIVDITERKKMEAERQRLEREVLEAGEMERKRIGQELHDSLGQQLLGIAFLSDALKERLHQKSLPDAADAGQIATLIEKVMSQARELSRGLYAAELESQGLIEALKQLVANINGTTKIRTQFICNKPFKIDDKAKATHIYRIAQEALHNARRHSMATEIVLTVDGDENELKLTIKDNGIGMSNASQPTGMGLKIMRYRTDIIGGTLQASNDPAGGTVVAFAMPLRKTVLSK